MELSRRLGQPFVFDYKPAANTTIGAKSVATAAPDGYTLFFSNAIGAHRIFNLNNAVDANRKLTSISIGLHVAVLLRIPSDAARHVAGGSEVLGGCCTTGELQTAVAGAAI